GRPDLDARSHRLQGSLSRNTERLRVGAAQTAHDVRRPDRRLFPGVPTRASLQARPADWPVPLGFLRRRDQGGPDRAPCAGLPADEGAVLGLDPGRAVDRKPAPRYRRLSPLRAARGGVPVMPPLVGLCGVSKTFWIPSVRRTTIREHVFGLFEPARVEPLRALLDVNLELFPGETLGIMGRNGSGKS